MDRFTLEERWEILKNYFQCECCVAETVRNLKRIYGRAPSAAGISKFIKKVRETGMLVDKKNYPRTRTVCTDEIIAAVAQSVLENPTISIRLRAQQLNISRTSLRRILDKHLRKTVFGNDLENDVSLSEFISKKLTNEKKEDRLSDESLCDEPSVDDTSKKPNKNKSDKIVNKEPLIEDKLSGGSSNEEHPNKKRKKIISNKKNKKDTSLHGNLLSEEGGNTLCDNSLSEEPANEEPPKKRKKLQQKIDEK